MKLTSSLILINILNISFIHCRRVVGEGNIDTSGEHDYNLKRAIKGELEIASDQIVEIIAQHEKLLQDQHHYGTSFIQDGWKATAKRITKNAAIQIAKRTVPTLAEIVAASVKPPNTDPMVYDTLFMPVCRDIFTNIGRKLHVQVNDDIWNYKSEDDEDEDEDFELDDADEDELE